MVHSPYLPEHVVATSTNDGLFGMKNNSSNRHGVTFLSLTQNSLLVVELLSDFRRLLFRERSKLCLFVLSHVGLGLDLGQTFFLPLGFNFEFVSFNFDEGLFLHGVVIFFIEFFVLLFVLVLESMQSFDILVQFFLFFLNPLMVHLVEVPFFK